LEVQYINAFRRSGAMTATIADGGGQAGVPCRGTVFERLRLTRSTADAEVLVQERRIVDQFADRTCI
jgi:hypothetical protein